MGERKWLIVGILPVNCDTTATLRDCIDALRDSYGAKLKGAWLLVAP